MIGRGALGNPQIFSEIKSINPEMNKKDILKLYLKYMQEYFSPKLALLESRAHIMFFLKGEKNSTNAKIQIMKAESLRDVINIVDNFYK